MLSFFCIMTVLFDTLGTLAPLNKKSSKSLDFTMVVTKK